MTGGLGPYGAKGCNEIVAEFMQCRRQKGIPGMLAGECALLYEQMNACLDEESKSRRRENLIRSKERLSRYEKILRMTKNSGNVE